MPESKEGSVLEESKERNAIQYFSLYCRHYLVSPPERPDKPPLVRFGSKIGRESFGCNGAEEHAAECSFSCDRLKKCPSSVPSPSYTPFRPAVSNSRSHVLNEILVLSIKSGLKRINAFELISKLKLLAFRGKGRIKMGDFMDIVTSMKPYKYLPAHCLKLMKQHLTSFFKNFDSKSTPLNEKVDRGEVSYRNIGRGLIVLCGGSVEDKTDAVKVLYERYGVQDVEASELADLCEGMFRLYSAFDPKTFAKAALADVAAETATKCCEILQVCGPELIKPWQLRNWVEGKRKERVEDPASLSKVAKRHQIDKSFKESLKRLLRNKELFNFVKVAAN